MTVRYWACDCPNYRRLLRVLDQLDACRASLRVVKAERDELRRRLASAPDEQREEGSSS